FELVVVERMRLDLHGQALDGGVGRGTLRHRPGEHDAAMLETEVVVETGRAVLLDHELTRMARATPRFAPRPLASHTQTPLAVVLGEPSVPAEVGQLFLRLAPRAAGHIGILPPRRQR